MADLGAERFQGIIYRNPHRAHCPNQTAFADTLGAGPGRCLGCLDMIEHDIGHLGGHRDEIVGHRSVQQVGVVAIDAFFEKNCNNALHDPAAHLFIERHIRVSSKQELKERLMAAVDYFNCDPVVHTWTYKLDNAA